MCFTPGPNNALAMATGMDKGFRAALPFCIGAAAGANISLVFLGFGLNSVFTRFPMIYDFLRYAGAAYMLWLAWHIGGFRLGRFRKKSGGKGPASGVESASDAPEPSALAARIEEKRRQGIRPLGFGQAALLQLVNVKVWLTNVIVISNYVGTGPDMRARFWTTVVLFSILGCAAMCSWAAGGMFLSRFLTSDGMRRANYLFAAFLAFSVLLLFVQE